MDGLVVQLLFIFHLLCSSFAFLSDARGKENNLQTFFNNETSMRHCLKLLGIQVYLIILNNSLCQVLITVVTFISEIFACNMKRSRLEFQLFNWRSFMLFGNKCLSDFRCVRSKNLSSSVCLFMLINIKYKTQYHFQYSNPVGKKKN